MRPTLVLIALALASACPGYASEGAATGGLTVPRGATGGLAVPGESATGGTQGETPTPGGGALAVAPPERPAGAAAPTAATRSAAPVRAHAAQEEGQPGAPAPPERPEGGDVEVEVPVDEDANEPSAPRPAPSVTPFGGLAPTGLAVAAFALLGALAAAAGLGVRRLARRPSH
jgi:hypothetical protein